MATKKSRKGTLLVLSIIGILGLLCVIWMRHKPNRFGTETSISSHSFLAQRSDGSTSVPVLPPRSMDQLPKPSSTLADAPAAPSDEANRNDRPSSTSLRSPAADAVVASGSGTSAFGVVDLERLIAAQQGEDSPETRARILREIKHIVALRATVHGFAFVFDISAKSANGTPFILATNGAPDITEEVLHELSQ